MHATAFDVSPTQNALTSLKKDSAHRRIAGSTVLAIRNSLSYDSVFSYLLMIWMVVKSGSVRSASVNQPQDCTRHNHHPLTTKVNCVPQDRLEGRHI